MNGTTYTLGLALSTGHDLLVAFRSNDEKLLEAPHQLLAALLQARSAPSMAVQECRQQRSTHGHGLITACQLWPQCMENVTGCLRSDSVALRELGYPDMLLSVV